MKITDRTDLFYPDGEAKKRASERRKQIRESGTHFMEDLQLEGIKRLISLGGSERFMALAEELSDDIPTLEYRLDCLDDFLNIPELSETFRRMIAELSGRRPGLEDGSDSRVDSFYDMNEKMDELTFFISSVSEINRLLGRIKNGVKSAAVKDLIDFFENLPTTDEYIKITKNLGELRQTFSKTVKSVKVGINFDTNMLPDSAGIIEVSDRRIYPKGNVIERIVYGALPDKEKFTGEEHLNSASRHTPPDIDTALFKELSDYTRDYAKRISEALKSYRSGFFTDLSELEQQLDYYISAAAFIKSVRSRGMPMCRPKLLPKESRSAKISGLYDLNFYKQLVSEDALAKLSGKIVLNSVALDENAGFYMVTGANNGGKTTFARAVGLCRVLAQTGMYLPAESAEISICDNIFTHFPHDEKIGIDTSRFTEEIKELREIVRNVTPYSVVVMNESLQSTTPEECLKIAGIHLELLAAAGVRGIYVTHLTGLYAVVTELNKKGYPTRFGSLVSTAEEETEKRFYKMLPQPPSSESSAFAIYKKFGATIRDLRAAPR